MDELQEAIQDALAEHIASDGELISRWSLVAEVSRPGESGWIAHRSGGFGGDSPSLSQAIGMLGGSLALAITQYVAGSRDPEE